MGGKAPLPAEINNHREVPGNMNKQEANTLIREYLVLRKRKESLKEELKALEERYDEVGNLLYGYRSKRFIRSLLLYLAELEEEYSEDTRYDDLISSIISVLQNYEEYDADRRNYTPKELLHLYDEEME